MFPFPRDLPHPATEPASPASAGGFFTTEHLRSPHGGITAFVKDPAFHLVRTLQGIEVQSLQPREGAHQNLAMRTT